MKINYRVQEKDFYAYQLYEASKSERIQKNNRNNWVIMTIIPAAFSIYFIITKAPAMSAYFAVLTAVVVLFYPKYISWKHKKHHLNTVQQYFAPRFGETPGLEITTENLITSDEEGEEKIPFAEIEVVNETQEHFFVKLLKGGTLIVPKMELKNPAELKDKFVALKVPIWEELDWEWK